MCKLLLFIILFNYTYADNLYAISGRVTNTNNEPIENVIIKSLENDNLSTTDIDGYFTFFSNQPSPKELTFTHIGYIEITKMLDPRTKDLKIIILEPSVIPSEEIVVTSRRKETPIKDSPILIHIIDEATIKETSYSNIEELIEFVMPNIQSTHDNHGDQDIKIQGLDSKYTMFLIDGNRISAEYAGNIDFSIFNMNSIDRIEIVRGGLSTVYGSGAMGGVVNIITKELSNPYWLSYNTFYDMPKQFSNSLGLGFNIKDFSYSFNLNHKSTDGYDLTENNPSEEETYNINKTQEEFTSISFDHVFRYRFDGTSFIRANYKNYSKDIKKYKNIAGSRYLQSELPKFSEKVLSLSYNKLFNNSSLSISYQNESHVKEYYFPYYYTSLPSVTNHNPGINGKTFPWSKPSVNTASILYNCEFKSHKILAGIDYMDQSYESVNILSQNGTTLIESIFDLDKTEKMNDLSFFILDNYKINTSYEVDLGLRVNYNSKYKATVSPSLSVKTPIKNYIYRINYSESYRSPSLKELYYSFGDHPGGFPIIGNSDLSPSSSDYYSLSIESLKRRSNSLEIYFNDVSNMIANRFEELSENDPTIVYKYHNYKSVKLYGLNLNILFSPFKNIEFKSTYSYTNAMSEYKDILDGISAHSINLELKYKLSSSCDMMLSTKYNSNKTIDISLEDENNLRTEVILPGYQILNFSYIKNFQSGNYIKFGVKNLLDYIDSNPLAPDFLSSYEPGRRLYISLNLNISKGRNE